MKKAELNKEKCYVCGEQVCFGTKEAESGNDEVCPICKSNKMKSELSRDIMDELIGLPGVSLLEAKAIIEKREIDKKNLEKEIEIITCNNVSNKEKIEELSEELKLLRGTKGWVMLEKLRRTKKSRFGILKIKKSVDEIGLKGTIIKIINKLMKLHDQGRKYKQWIKVFEPTEEELKLQAGELDKFTYKPRISILVPVFETDKVMLIEMIESVRNQTYTNWELCIADGNSKGPQVKEVLDNYISMDPRIKVNYLKENKGIIGNSNEALYMCKGDYISLLDHDDTLAPFALYEIVKVINTEGAEFVYSDEDKINKKGNKRHSPHFKPDWSPDTLRSYNYITHMVTMKAELARAVGGFRTGFEGSQDHDLILRATSAANKVSHISKILYHWRAHENSAAGNGDAKPYAVEAGKRAVTQSLLDNGIIGSTQDGIMPGTYRATYEINKMAKVAIIIPNKDKVDTLKSCINSIINRSSYKNYEILVVENSSVEKQTFEYYDSLKGSEVVKIIEYSGEFNYSVVNNYATSFTDAEYYIFLNNDVEVITIGWIEAMLEHAQRHTVGVVGAKLVYEDNRVQHSGVVVGMKGWADHVCAGLHQSEVDLQYYYKFVVDTIRNTSAVTGACMMVSKLNFEKLRGFDERFVLCGSDVELCLRMLKNGLVNVYTPYAKLFHYESLTRKNMEIPENDFKLSYEAYKEFIFNGDPYYNRNFDYRKLVPTILTEKLELRLLNSYARNE